MPLSLRDMEPSPAIRRVMPEVEVSHSPAGIATRSEKTRLLRGTMCGPLLLNDGYAPRRAGNLERVTTASS